METLLHRKSDSFKFLTSFSLDIRAWSTETLTKVALLSYSGVLTHSVPLVSLFMHWKYLKLSFFDVFIGGGSRTAAASKIELFVIIVNGWKLFTIITKSSILDVAAGLDPPLQPLAHSVYLAQYS